MQKSNIRFMSDLRLCQETPVLLTRTEVRRFLRVNEVTIDCWLRDHKLEQLPRPEQSDCEVMIALHDEGLRDRVRRRIEERGDVDLTIESLPAMARFQLLKMMMRTSRKGSQTTARGGPRMRPLRLDRRRRRIRRSRTATPRVARWESSPMRSRKASSRAGATGKGRRLGRRRQFRSRLQRRGSQRRLELGTELSEQTVDMQFSPKPTVRRRRMPVVQPGEDLSALQAIAEASDQAEVVEAVWDDDLLSLVNDVAESVAEEVQEQLEHELEMAPAEVEEDETWLALDGVGHQDGELVALVIEDEAVESAVNSEEEELDDGFLELDLGAMDWMPGEEMVEALSHSPVFAAAEPSAEGAAEGAAEPSAERAAEHAVEPAAEPAADVPSPSEFEIDELFTPLTTGETEAQPESNDFVSEEVAALYRIEEHLAEIEESTVQHREAEFAEFAEVRADIAATWSQEAEIIESVGKLQKDVTVLKSGIKATRNSARSSLAVSRRTQTQMRKRLSNLGLIQVGGKSAAAVLPIAAGVLITSWAMTIFLKTGDLRMALGGLVLVNVLACASLLHSKTGRFF